MDQLFRSEALKRLQTPDQIDRVMRVTKPSGWIALSAFGLVLLTAAVWSLVGSLPIRVAASGILLAGEHGVQSVEAVAAGRLIEINVNDNDEVKKGQIIARIELADLTQKIEDLKQQLATYTAERDRQAQFYELYNAEQRKNMARQRAALQSNLASTEESLVSLREILTGYETLRKEGIATQIQVAQAREKLFSTQSIRDQIHDDLNAITIRDLELDYKRNQDLEQYNNKVLQTQFQLVEAQNQLKHAGFVVAPVDGKIVQLQSQADTYVSAGAVIAVMQFGSGDLVGYLYAPAVDGKRVKIGMPVNVAPSTIRREEYGTIIGRVTSVSAIPETTDSIGSRLNNDLVIKTILAKGPPLAIHVALETDPNNVSGYRWSSKTGPEVAIDSGTLANAEITVSARAPITFVLPALRRWLGIQA